MLLILVKGPYYLLLTSLPSILCGGGIASIMAVYVMYPLNNGFLIEFFYTSHTFR